MDILIKALQFILSLAILVTLHEFGHFIPAKLFKTRIEKFYLFFNPWFSFIRFKKVGGKNKYSWFSRKSPEEWNDNSNNTEWGIGWLPLGGYVKIAGMIDESMDKEQMSKPAQPHEFRSKKAWQRLVIMIGGVVVNLFLGFFIYSMILFTWGSNQLNTSKLKEGMSVHPYLHQYGIHSGDIITHIDGIHIESVDDLNRGIMLRDKRKLKLKRGNQILSVTLPKDIDQQLFQHGAMSLFSLRSHMGKVKELASSSNAEKAGIKLEDQIIEVDGIDFEYFDEFQNELYNKKGKSVTLTLLRNKEMMRITSSVSKEGTLGFTSQNILTRDTIAIEHLNYSFGKSLIVGTQFGVNFLSDYISQFKFIFTKKGASSLGGFATIGNMFSSVWDWKLFWLNTAFLSIVLAFMNILPIPALDGGHVVFLLYEIITGKEAPQKVLEYAQYVGIVLLLSLMLYANGNDLIRLFLK